LFSWTYVGHALATGSRYPTILTAKLQGKDIGVELHKRRRRVWTRVGPDYRQIPKRVRGFKIYLNPEDTGPVSTSVGTDGILDLPLTCLMLKLLKKGMSFVDIGANLGYFTLLGAKAVGDSGRVYAFEPESLNFRLLSKSINENKFRNVEIHNQVVSDTNGIVKLFKADVHQPGGHSIGTDRGLGFEDVQSTTLDGFWETSGRQRWDMLKIHVTGDDPMVLRGATGVLNELHPMIAMVFDPPKWEQHRTLLSSLFEMYAVYEIIESPFLLRKVEATSLGGPRLRPLFMTRPRSN